MNSATDILQTPIEYLTGISAVKGDLLRKELSIFTWKDLLQHYPIRHLDKTKIDAIGSLNRTMDYAFLSGTVISVDLLGEGRGKRLVAKLKDASGIADLVWFQGISWMQKYLVVGRSYRAFGRLGFFLNTFQITHPELKATSDANDEGLKNTLEPIYPSTEKLKAKSIGAADFSKFVAEIFHKTSAKDFEEFLNVETLERYKLMGEYEAIRNVHFPPNQQAWQQAVRRIKFDELFLAQMRLQLVRLKRLRHYRGPVFQKVGDYFQEYYNNHLPFELTGAQKRVIKEIRNDTANGRQMSRLLQGDVGSGKTMVAMLTMLIAAGNGFQSVLMAPTEILARQHFDTISSLLEPVNISVALLTGSVKGKQRKEILGQVADGRVSILIGTHAVIEDKVIFENLGLVVIDEQHKFGVAQRAKLQKKNVLSPHVLVMTATPIPRTLALTAYGDLDYSVIDELPPGRKPIDTHHLPELDRPKVMNFIRDQIEQGRQAYIIYPLIEESEKLDYENLFKGYEEVKSFFPEPKYWISMVHGRQSAEEKATNMSRFVSGDTQIMVSTTVIEVGVNVPNASVMVIESTEKFGLSQLHQLRGRVGRGAEKSYCVLLTGRQLSNDARERIKIMTATNDGFKIAEKDLELRGPGEIDGTRQSGTVQFRLASIVMDKAMLEVARDEAIAIIEEDPELDLPKNASLKQRLVKESGKTAWSKIA